ncbi:uncharacterized protein LOC143861535 [Tasmannia lanceolata]|uniref:uncharacterized protein LOC143861535 n=1 Tax=Tasmannia lanceolata TaxID=3420 RepID=UPI004062D99F
MILRAREYAKPFTCYEIGLEDDIDLWDQPWHPSGTLSSLIPRSRTDYSLSSLNLLSEIFKDGTWNPLLDNPSLREAKTLIMEAMLNSDAINIPIWKPATDGVFTTKIGWETLRMKSGKPPWISSVWFAGNNPTHALTTWKALKQKLSTKDRLIKMGAVIDPICPLCKSAAESIDHLFFKCSYSAWLWKSILWRNGHHRAKNQSLLAEEDWLRHHSKGKEQATVAFKLCFSPLIHNIWMERNRRIFESSEKHKRLVLNQILTEISIKMNGLKIKDKISPRNISTATNLKYKHIPDDPSSRYCSWSPPNEDELKLNSDASLDSL